MSFWRSWWADAPRREGWLRATAGFRQWFSDSMGFNGPKNASAWVVAGTFAYVFWLRPEMMEAEQREIDRKARWKLYKERGIDDVDRARPRPDPQDRGLLVGKKKIEAAAEEAHVEA